MIRIGSKAATTNERINLVTTQSDAILVVSCNIPSSPTNIVFNNTSRFGNCNSTFYLSECNVPYFTISSNQLSVFSMLNLGLSNMSLNGSVLVSSNLQCGSLTTNTASVLSVQSPYVRTSNLATCNISFLNSNIISFNQVAGSNNLVLINADTRLTGTLTLDNIVTTHANIANLSFPSLSFVTQPGGTSNVIDIQTSTSTGFTSNLINIAVDQVPALVVNSQGWVGINTSTPRACVQLQSVPPIKNPLSCNLVQINSPSNSFIIDNNSQIGIGTSSGLTHQFTIYSSNNNTAPVQALIGLSTNGMNPAPILSASRNGSGSVFISPEGNVVLGNVSYDTGYMLKVQGRTTTAALVTNSLRSTGAANPIDLGFSSLSNISSISANICAIQGSGSFSSLTSTSSSTTNFTVPGVITLNTTQAQIDAPSVLFTSPQVSIGSNLSQSRVNGQLVVRVPDVAYGNTAFAMTVLGNTTTRSVIQLLCGTPALVLSSTANSSDPTVATQQAGLSLDLSGLYMSYSPNGTTDLTSQTYRQLKINTNGVRLAQSIQITTSDTTGTKPGYMGIGLPGSSESSPTLPSYRLHIDGSVWVQSASNSPASATDTPYFYINETNGNVGILTNSPQRTLHVAGTFYAQSVETRLPVVTTSDSNLKTDILPITDALEKVRALTGYTFSRRPETSRAPEQYVRETGLLAQDVQKVLPEAVSAAGEHLGVTYGNLAGLFVEAIKAMSDKILALEEKIASNAVSTVLL